MKKKLKDILQFILIIILLLIVIGAAIFIKVKTLSLEQRIFWATFKYRVIGFVIIAVALVILYLIITYHHRKK